MPTAIDLWSEETVTLAEVAEQLAARLGGRRISRQTMHNWAAKGRKGVILPTIIVAGVRRTSLRAVAEFCTEQAAVGRPTSATPPTPAGSVDTGVASVKRGW